MKKKDAGEKSQAFRSPQPQAINFLPRQQEGLEEGGGEEQVPELAETGQISGSVGLGHWSPQDTHL